MTLDIVKKYQILGENKIVAAEILRDLTNENQDYEIEKYFIKVDNSDLKKMLCNKEKRNGFFVLKGDELNNIKEICIKNRIPYELEFETDESDEIIC